MNESLRDDELRAVLAKLESQRDKDVFGLVCKRWLHLQSTERKRLSARAGPHMLRKMASRFPRLHELDLSQCLTRSFYPGVTDSDLSVISNAFSSLRLLSLHNCKGVTDAGIVTIGSGLPSLQSLDVSYCRKLTDKGLSAVALGCSDLRTLHLACCRYITDAFLHALSNSCRHLQHLALQGCTNISDSGLSDLVKGCQRIEFLDLNKCSNVGDIGVTAVSNACSSFLKTIKLLDCYKVGDQSIMSLAQFCNNLETLIIGGCRDISDASIKFLANSCKASLRNLRMDWCLNITDSCLSCILVQCGNLEALDIGCCAEVSDAAFQALNGGETLSLKVLKLSNCPKISVAGIAMVLEKCNMIEYLDVRSCPQITKRNCDEAGLQFPQSCKVNFIGSLREPDVLL